MAIDNVGFSLVSQFFAISGNEPKSGNLQIVKAVV